MNSISYELVVELIRESIEEKDQIVVFTHPLLLDE